MVEAAAEADAPGAEERPAFWPLAVAVRPKCFGLAGSIRLLS